MIYIKLCFVFIFLLNSIYCDLIDYKKASDLLEKNSEYRNFDSPHLRFISFMRDYDKIYSSKSELYMKLRNFNRNIIKAELLQQKDQGTANFGITKFSDLSEKELIKYTGLRIPPNEFIYGDGEWRNHTRENKEKEALDFVIHNKDDIPKQFDWRDKGVISSVKDQSRCQCCWAFSTSSTVEAQNAIKNKKLIELSVQQLVDCDQENDGCNGGLMDLAFQYIIKAGGLETEKDYPYKSRDGDCLAKQNDGKFKVKVKSYKRLIKNEDEMKKWIYKNGPLSIGLNALGIMYYRNGILDLDEHYCKPLNQNHALLLIGYGEEIRKSDGENVPFWIVKNTWGTDFGENGYFRIRRGKNTCGIAEYVHGVETI